MRYNQKLANVCEQMQLIDSDGSYIELFEMYADGEISLCDALTSVKNTVKEMLGDVGDDKILIDLLRYIER